MHNFGILYNGEDKGGVFKEIINVIDESSTRGPLDRLCASWIVKFVIIDSDSGIYVRSLNKYDY